MWAILIVILFIAVIIESVALECMNRTCRQRMENAEAESDDVFEKYNELANNTVDMKRELEDLRERYKIIKDTNTILNQQLEDEINNSELVRRTVEQAVELLKNIKE